MWPGLSSVLGVMVSVLPFMFLVLGLLPFTVSFHSRIVLYVGPVFMYLLNMMVIIWLWLLVIVLFGGITFVISGGRFRARFRN